MARIVPHQDPTKRLARIIPTKSSHRVSYQTLERSGRSSRPPWSSESRLRFFWRSP